MVMRYFRQSGDDRLEHVEQKLLSMLADDRHSFDLAASALLGGAAPETVGQELRDTDRRVNEGVREIRRELIVHSSVHGSISTPAVLVYMSIVKDVERVGDYAKNIFDLADLGADFSDAPDRGQLIGYRDRVSALISETGPIFVESNGERARRILGEADDMLDQLDNLVADLCLTAEPGHQAVPRALFYRHLKRIGAHLMNVLSAVIMPVDHLDYFDEDRETRI